MNSYTCLLFYVLESLQDIQSSVKCPPRCLVHAKSFLIFDPVQTSVDMFSPHWKSLMFGPIENLHEYIWSLPKGPWYLLLSKNPYLEKSPGSNNL